MRWNQEWHMSDEALGMPHAGPEDDLRTVANDLPLHAVVRAKRAADAGRLIRRAYHEPGRGCLLYFLTRVRSKAELLAFDFSEAAGWSARRLVRYFDNGQIDAHAVSRILAEHIAIRRQANRLEGEVRASAGIKTSVGHGVLS